MRPSVSKIRVFGLRPKSRIVPPEVAATAGTASFRVFLLLAGISIVALVWLFGARARRANEPTTFRALGNLRGEPINQVGFGGSRAKVISRPARDGAEPLAQGTPMQALRGPPIGGAGQSAGNSVSNTLAGMTFITNVDQINPPAQGKTATPEIRNGFSVVGFEKLASFPITGYTLEPIPAGSPSNSKPSEQIPEEVKALDRHALAVRGFMMPMKGSGGLCTEFLLLRNRSACCYGLMPRLNEWIVVSMPGKGVKPLLDQPITISGKLHVGEVYRYDRLVGIYQMDGERMEGPNQ